MSARVHARWALVTCVGSLMFMSGVARALQWEWASDITGASTRTKVGLAVSANALHATWWQATTDQTQYARSLDDGLTWQDSATLSTENPHPFGHYIVTSGTDVVAFWSPENHGSVKYARSLDEGVSWQSEGQFGSGSAVYICDVAQDGATIVVLWGDLSSTPASFYVSRSPDSGVTWDAPRLVVNASWIGLPGVGLFGGSLVVVYEEAPSGTATLLATVSSDDGATWSAPFPLQSGLVSAYSDKDLAWDGSRIVAVWSTVAAAAADGNPWSAYSDDGGSTWSSPQMIAADINYNTRESNVVYTASGFYAAYADGPDLTANIMYYSHSIDGMTWTADAVGLPASDLDDLVASPGYVFAGTSTPHSSAPNAPLPVSRAALPYLIVAEPSNLANFVDGTEDISITVDIGGTAVHWQWRANEPFPASGPGGGTSVISGQTARVPVLAGANVIYVALVDATDTLLSPSVTDSVAIAVGGAAAPAGGALVTLPNVNGAAGQTVLVPMSVSDTTGLGIEAASLSLSYDATVLTPLTAGTTLVGGILDPAKWSVEQNTAEAGTWHIALATAAGATPSGSPTGSGKLVTLEFAVDGLAMNGVASLLTLTRAELNEGLVSTSTVVGVFMVLDVVYGDVTGNGAATSYDAAYVLGHVADELGSPGSSPPFPIELTPPVWSSVVVLPFVADIVANVDPSDGIAALDAALILQYDVGLITVFPVEAAAATPARELGSPAYDLRGLAASPRPGAQITVTLDASAMRGLHAGELVLDYDGALLRPVDVSLRATTKAGGTQRPALAQREVDGRLAVAFASARPLEGADAALEVTFEAAGNVSRAREGTIRASHLRLNGSLIGTDFAFPFRVEPFANRLMANYPNPFNPETWIPFELAEAADVTVRVYGVDGRLVRTLELGRRDVGEYAGRDEAAYWDGANASGEAVASGVYIYELTAGDYHAVRRMLVLK